MAIDGNVDVLSTTGNMTRFTGGSTTEFKILGLPNSFSKTTGFFTSDEVENIYIWDDEAKRIFVLNKEGGYRAQYILPRGTTINVRKILADEVVKKVFLVSSEKIYAVDLR